MGSENINCLVKDNNNECDDFNLKILYCERCLMEKMVWDNGDCNDKHDADNNDEDDEDDCIEDAEDDEGDDDDEGDEVGISDVGRAISGQEGVLKGASPHSYCVR